MKKIVALILIMTFLCISLASCHRNKGEEITCQDVIDAYSQYDEYIGVFHNEDSCTENGVCYVEVSEADGDYIIFEFYDTVEHAKEAEREYNVVIWLFGVIYGETRWLHTGTYNNIGFEYLDKDMMKPFWDLIKEKN